MSKYRTLMPTYLEDWRQKDGGDGGYNGGGNLPPLYDHFTVYPPDVNDWSLSGSNNHENGTEINLRSGGNSILLAQNTLAGTHGNFTYNRRMYIEWAGSLVTSPDASFYFNIGGGDYRCVVSGNSPNTANSGSYFELYEVANPANTSGQVYFGNGGGSYNDWLNDYTFRFEYNSVGFIDYNITGNGANYTGSINHTDSATRNISNFYWISGTVITGAQYRIDRVEADNL